METTHENLARIFAEHNRPLVWDRADVPQHIWRLFYFVDEAQTLFMLNTKESEELAKLYLGICIMQSVAMLEAMGAEVARIATSTKFPRFAALSSHLARLQSPLSRAYRAWVQEDKKDLGINIEIFVVLTTTFLESLSNAADAEAVLVKASEALRLGVAVKACC